MHWTILKIWRRIQIILKIVIKIQIQLGLFQWLVRVSSNWWVEIYRFYFTLLILDRILRILYSQMKVIKNQKSKVCLDGTMLRWNLQVNSFLKLYISLKLSINHQVKANMKKIKQSLKHISKLLIKNWFNKLQMVLNFLTLLEKLLPLPISVFTTKFNNIWLFVRLRQNRKNFQNIQI